MTPQDIPKVMADACGVDESAALALMATAINGMIGRRNTLGDLAGTLHVPPMEVAVVDDRGAATDFINRLLEPARYYQKLTIARFRETDIRLLNDIVVGTEGSHIRLEAYEDLRAAIYGKNNKGDRLDHSLQMDTSARLIDWDLDSKGLSDRLDLILRPGFLIESPSTSTLKRDLQNLHMASGLIVGGTGLGVDCLSKAVVENLHRVLSAERIPVPEILTRGRKGLTEESHLAWIFQIQAGSLERHEIRRLMRDALLLDGKVGAPSPIPDFQLASSAYHAWSETVAVALRIRRTGGGYGHALETVPQIIEFEERYRLYRQQCNEAGLGSRTILQLPRLLLCLPVKARTEADHRLSVEQCFHHAEVLLKRHQMILREVDGYGQINDELKLAGRLLEKIKARSPLGQRELIRSFDKQRAELYVPTLELMLQAGIIKESKPKVYVPGPVQGLEASLRPLLVQQQLKIVA